MNEHLQAASVYAAIALACAQMAEAETAYLVRKQYYQDRADLAMKKVDVNLEAAYGKGTVKFGRG